MTYNDLMRDLPELFGSMLAAILFIQSGLDKVVDWKGNLGWLTGHFEKTFIAPVVPLLLAVLTVMEVATGVIFAAGIVYFLTTGSVSVFFYASILGALTLISLFFGQRIAKDYPGAAVLVPYFLLILAIMFLTSPNR